MSEVYSTTNIGNYRIKIMQDEYPENPRTAWDNLGTMVCFHNRYGLGDAKHGYNPNDYNGWSEVKAKLFKDGAFVILPLFLYDHSGITMSTQPFSCRWDSGQVGFIFITHKKAKAEYGKDYKSKEIEIGKYLTAEVQTYDDYLTGNVYGFEISKVSTCNKGCEHEEEMQSCYGYYGDEGEKEALEEAKRNVEAYQRRDLEYSVAEAVLFSE